MKRCVLTRFGVNLQRGEGRRKMYEMYECMKSLFFHTRSRILMYARENALCYFWSCSWRLCMLLWLPSSCRCFFPAGVCVASKGGGRDMSWPPYRHGTVKTNKVPDTVGTSGRNISSCEGVLPKGRIYSAVWSGHSPAERCTECSRTRFFLHCLTFRASSGEIFYTLIYVCTCVEKERLHTFIHLIHLLLCLTGKDLDSAFSFPVKDCPRMYAIFMVTRNVGEKHLPVYSQVHQKERPLNTFDLSSGNSTPDKVRRLELKLGRISTVALLLPCGTVMLTWAEIPTPITLIDK